MKVTLYIAISLDGFIARKNKSVDWLDKYNDLGEDFGYAKFYESIDTVVLGNTTNNQFSNAYADKNCYVFSRTKKGKQKKSIYVNSSPSKFLETLPKDTNVWLVGGANLVNQFLKKNLIDEFIITIIPTFLGGGIRLFEEDNKELSLERINTTTYDCGVVQITYKINE